MRHNERVVRILWLHDMEPEPFRRLSVKSLETCLARNRYGRGHEVLVHDAKTALPIAARKISWDGIVLGPTFLCARYSPKAMKQVARRFAWIAESKAVKIALPQDDYDCSALLDRWMVNWQIDICYSILPKYQTLLYPEFSKTGELVPSFTGFVDDDWVRPLSRLRSINSRHWDVVYRATRLPANFGSLGALKSEIAGRFIQALSDRSMELRVDIKTGQETIAGESWHDFLENSRFTLATPSGSSLLDPEGDFRRCVAGLSGDFNFDHIATRCFPGQDRRYMFECIAPRHLEASLLGTVQLAVPGDYSGILDPSVHYIPLEQDLSNLDQVLGFMSEEKVVTRVQAAAYERVTSVESLQLRSFANGLLRIVQERSPNRRQASLSPKGRTLSMREVERKVAVKSRIYWARKRSRDKIRYVLNMVGLLQILRKTRSSIRPRS